MTRNILVTGSAGLVGAEVSRRFHGQGFRVHGVDDNHRAVFFGPMGDTRRTRRRLVRELSRYRHHDLDVRDRRGMADLVRRVRPEVIVHAAAQPSHDRAAQIPFEDFETNAVGTLNLLEAARRFCPESPFIHLSTNKVYGDAPNALRLKERKTRWEFADPLYKNGIAETFSIDRSTHSLFGVSKAASDLLVQEYGRYFGMPTCCLRAGCMTGPGHAGVELHGFLSYLVRCNVEGRRYRVFGYKGKQVRDNVHAADVASFIWEFSRRPRRAEVYNMGGGKGNSCSILEAFRLAEEATGRRQAWSYEKAARKGDHICYYSDLAKMKAHYPRWRITRTLPEMVRELADAWRRAK